jgi:hypothetical protein
MSQVKEKIFFDSNPEKVWFKTFEALMIKNRDHRRILNRQPVFYDFFYVRFVNLREIVKVKDWNIDFKILNN